MNAPHLRPGRPFRQVDVFCQATYSGAPLAVVLDGQNLSDAQMQAFARWTGLSETTFVLPPSDAARAQGADYRVRIYTPGGELPFAGHPTLGTCHAWLQAGGQPQSSAVIVQECGVGLVRIRVVNNGIGDAAHPSSEQAPAAPSHQLGSQVLAFAAPPMTQSPVDANTLLAVCQAAGLPLSQVRDAAWLQNGPLFLALWLPDAEAVLSVQADHAALRRLGVNLALAGPHTSPDAASGSALIAQASAEARAFRAPGGLPAQTSQTPPAPSAEIEVRVFVDVLGIEEDPVTGSLNASLAGWLMAQGHMPRQYTAYQGSALGLAGLLHLNQDEDGQVWVAGRVSNSISGQVAI